MDKFKATIIVVVIFFALLAFVYFFEKDKETKEEKELKKDELLETQVADFNVSDVKKLIINNQEITLSLEKREDKWILLEDEGMEINGLKVETLLESLSKLSTKSRFAAEKLEDFGLNDPKTKVSVTLNEKSFIFTFGNATPDQTKSYIRLNDEKEVFTAPLTLKDSFELTKENFKKNQPEEEGTAMDEIEKLKKTQEGEK